MSDTPKEPTGWIVASDQRMIVRMTGEVMLDVHRKRLDQEPTEEAMWLLCDRIRELEAAALATDAQVAELQERWRLMGDWFQWVDVSDEPQSFSWRSGYKRGIADAIERYNELTPSSGAGRERRERDGKT